MTGLTFKNCDTFYRRVCIYLRLTSGLISGLTGGFISMGLGNFLIIGCLEIQAKSPSILALTSLHIISDAAATTSKSDNKSNPNKKIQTIEKAQYLPVTARAKLAGRTINLEVTRSIAEQAKGLMFRATLPDDRGMIFNFNPPLAISFWMKNVPVALDMVFIYQGKVVAIAASAPPCKASPCEVYPTTPVVTDQVIELRAGLAKELGLKVGDQITIEDL